MMRKNLLSTRGLSRRWKTTAVIGAGNMGRGVAKSLAVAGFDVRQYDLDSEALALSVAQHPKIKEASSLKECCADAEMVAVTVSNEKAERAVFPEIFSTPNVKTVLNLGTTSVSWARQLHDDARGAQKQFLDAPVSGGPEGAQNGALTVMLGGSEEAQTKALPLLEAISKKHSLLGGPGAGAAAKLVNQQLVAANAHSAAEALALAFALGCDLGKLTDLLESSWGQSTMFTRIAKTAHPVAERTGGFCALLDETSAAPLRNFVKDVALVADAAASVNITATCLAPAKHVLRDCASRGLLDVDWAAVAALATAASKPKSFACLERVSPPKILDVFADDYRKEIQTRAKRASVVPVVDDDPTGTQTVNNVNVLSFPWREQDVDNEFYAAQLEAGANRNHCFFILANTRALPEDAAVYRAKHIGEVLASKSQVQQNRTPLRCVASRSDSTLRGHFPAEVDALAEGLGWSDPVIVLAPFFFDGGRVTANNVHYVADPKTGELTPCAETEFAKDAAFRYDHSNLLDWVRSKVGDSVPLSLSTITLSDLRREGPDAVVRKIADVCDDLGKRRRVVIANALDANDAACLAVGLLRAEEKLFLKEPSQVSGIILRCAASLVAARCAIKKKPLLTAEDLFGEKRSRHGLVVVGSYVGKTTRQLEALCERCPTLKRVELSASAVCLSKDESDLEVRRVIEEIDRGFQNGNVVAMYTSRDIVRDDDDQDQHASSLDIGNRINDALCRVVSSVFDRPSAANAFVIAKGGITSNDVAVRALGVKRANVEGQIVPGVPVWRLGPETKLPGAPYVVFPGNVGSDDDLANVVDVIAFGKGGPRQPQEPSTKSKAPKPVLFTSDQEDPERAKILLLEARKRGRAVGAFNLYNLEGAVAVRKAVDYTGLPAVVQFHPASMAFGGTALIAACQDVAAQAVGAPMLVALDHADDADVIEKAIHRGVDYVMADGSKLNYEDNVAWTSAVVEHAKFHNVAVEAELGRLAGEEDGLAVSEKLAKYTDPLVVADFVRRTDVDCLAVTIGNVHGNYKHPPNLDWGRLAHIKAQLPDDIPLVLHGVSGLALPILHKAIAAGVCKFNVNTEVRTASRDAIKRASSQDKDVLDIMKDNVDAMVPVITAKMRALAPDLFPHS